MSLSPLSSLHPHSMSRALSTCRSAALCKRQEHGRGKRRSGRVGFAWSWSRRRRQQRWMDDLASLALGLVSNIPSMSCPICSCLARVHGLLAPLRRFGPPRRPWRSWPIRKSLPETRPVSQRCRRIGRPRATTGNSGFPCEGQYGYDCPRLAWLRWHMPRECDAGQDPRQCPWK